jgi:ABC-type uncharacterized transport system involved in gliding motility auxiliary subunit
LKESTGDGVVILVGDSDMLNDQVCVQVQNSGLPHGSSDERQPQPGAKFVEQLSGDSDLISLRSRASLNRPFTRLKEMEAKAGREWEDKGQGAWRREIRDRAQDQRIASRQVRQRTEVHPLARTAKGTGELSKDRGRRQQGPEIGPQELRKDTDSLEFWTKVVNIGAMPVLVALTGIVLAIGETQTHCRKMNRKQLILLLVALAIIGGAGWFCSSATRNPGPTPKRKDRPETPQEFPGQRCRRHPHQGRRPI